jgi:hypothetical protein
LKNSAFTRVAVIPYITRNYKKQLYGKLKVEWGSKFQAVYLHKICYKLGALHLLRKTAVPEKRFSTRRKMFRATFSDDFLYHALFGALK